MRSLLHSQHHLRREGAFGLCGPQGNRPGAARSALGAVGLISLFVFILFAPVQSAQSAVGGTSYRALHHVFGGGGGSAQRGSYRVDAIASGLGGISSHSASGVNNFAGYPGQITEEPSARDATYQVALNGSVSLTLAATDPDDDPLTFQLLSNPSHGTLTGTPPKLSYQADASFATFDEFTFAVHDGSFLSAPATVTFMATGGNAPPSIAPVPNQSVTEGQWLSFRVEVSDPDPPPQLLTISLGPGSPFGAAIDATTGVFTWTPTEAQAPAIYDFTVVVSDNGSPSLQATTQFRVTVAEENQSPILAPISDMSVPVGTEASFVAVGSDLDLPAQQVQFRLEPGAPSGAQIHPATGEFTWTPGPADAGNQYAITVVVQDNGAPPLSAKRTFTIGVPGIPPPPSNTPPVLSPIADFTAQRNQTIAFTAKAIDNDQPAQSLTFSLGLEAPGEARIDPGTGAFSWTVPGTQVAGDVLISVVVTDNGTPPLSASRTFKVTVSIPNTRPVLSEMPSGSITEGVTFTFPVLASDLDAPAQRLTYALGLGAPADASLDPITGVFSWTPAEEQGPGLYAIVLSVTDDGIPPLTTSGSFTITVLETNSAPVLALIPDQHVRAGETLRFTAHAIDADLPVQSLSFSLNQAPAGAAIDARTGLFTWTPPTNHPNGVVTLLVGVQDDALDPGRASREVRVEVVADSSTNAPRLHLTRESNSGLRLMIAGNPGSCFRVEFTTDLRRWDVLAVGAADDSGHLDLLEPLTPGTAGKWYRAVVVDCDAFGPPQWSGPFQVTQSVVRFPFRGNPNGCYVIEATVDFVTWTPVAVLQADTAGAGSFEVSISDRGARFFRALETSCP